MLTKRIPITTKKAKVLNKSKRSAAKKTAPKKKANKKNPKTVEVKTSQETAIIAKPQPVVNNPTPVSTKDKMKYNFRVGSKYMLDGTIYTVKELYDQDVNTKQIRIWSTENGAEVIMLETMMKERKDPNFIVIEE